MAREGRVRVADALAEVLHDLARDVRLGEPARDVDGTHHGIWLGEAEHVAHEDRVLVRRHAAIDDRPLSDGLHEPGVEAA